MVSSERDTRRRTPEGIAKIELLLLGKLRDGSAPQLISVALANSILFTPREETTVRAVTVSRALLQNSISVGKIFNTRKYMLMILFVQVSSKVYIQNDHL